MLDFITKRDIIKLSRNAIDAIGGEIELDAVAIGRKLKQLRGSRTIQEVSDATGIDTSTIGMYEIGQRVPRDNNKITLADFYGLTVQELFYDQEITDGDI